MHILNPDRLFEVIINHCIYKFSLKSQDAKIAARI